MKNQYSTQSYKEFKDREKRIQKAEEYDEKIDSQRNVINNIDDQIDEVKSMLETLQKERDKAVNLYNNIRLEKQEEMAIEYNDSSLLHNIYKYVDNTTYSKSKVAELKKVSEIGQVNMDIFDEELMNSYITAEKQINKEIPHTNMIMDFISKKGHNLKFPGEEDDSDDD